ncbi:hypothetical protein DP49_3986 [Burkholderia pseudomallei]|uniref:hypothetical protein n=1 Tax=Burkholderia pseudomallei TaxID=28450 RepID=UPI00050E72C6|nr:hypothetical protein [Burkholderia pseudomallei]KGD57289.1 hypothetical protein DP49_3986 [Burkholderia pseudomallei]KIX70271.1 hypothetical protein SZ30_00280 [Burkholderia pseudomallei]
MSQQIYAKIKRTSKYYGQTKPGERFPVHVEQQGEWEYSVHGNQNAYRLRDVNLFVVGKDGRELKIS